MVIQSCFGDEEAEEDKMGSDHMKEIRVDEKLGWGKSLFYGFQSVIALNLFLGAVVIAGMLKLDVTNTAILITVSLFAVGIATCIQAGLFMRYPVVQGVSFATIGAIAAIAIATIIASLTGLTDFSSVTKASWFALPPFFPFGIPKFDLTSSLIFVFIYFIVMIETVGNWFAISFTAKSTLTDTCGECWARCPSWY